MFTVHYMLPYTTLALSRSAPVFLKSFAAHGESKVVVKLIVILAHCIRKEN